MIAVWKMNAKLTSALRLPPAPPHPLKCYFTPDVRCTRSGATALLYIIFTWLYVRLKRVVPGVSVLYNQAQVSMLRYSWYEWRNEDRFPIIPSGYLFWAVYFLLLVNVSWNRFNSEEEESKCSKGEVLINRCESNIKRYSLNMLLGHWLAVTADVTDHSPAAVKEWRQCLLRECDPNEFILLRTWTGKFAICICC